MNSHSIRVLEFDKILARICGYGFTSWKGKEIQADPEGEFQRTREEVVDLMGKSQALMALISHPDFPGLPFIEDFTPVINTLGVQGASLELEDFMILMPVLVSAIALVRYKTPERLEQLFSLAPDTCSVISEIFSGLPDLETLGGMLLPYFDSQGTLKEEQIPELRTIRRKIQLLNQEVLHHAKQLLSNDAAVFNSDNPVFRDGRILLPMRSDARGKYQGIVHGSSDTGQTLFMEPQSLLEQNNELMQAQVSYEIEIRKIIRTCSRVIQDYLGELSRLREFYDYFDFLVMRARWIYSIGGSVPHLSEDHLSLTGVRHPLLGNHAVPLDIRFTEGKRIIIITGPNTGGKTVALKTLGLMSLLVRAGIAIPADEGSVIPWFPRIFADIGDEQSIEQSLSTFSAHLKNLGDIIAEAKDGDLVLIDELGTGTDPREGGALSLAILEALIDHRCFGLITTHHGSIKAYAYEHDTVENASMVFDDSTLSPTFVIRYGVPGESHAIDTAQRVGFPSGIVTRAREFASEKGSRLDTLLESLQEKERALEEAGRAATHEREALGKERQTVEQLRIDLEAQAAELKKQQLSGVNDYLKDARKEIQALIQEIKASGGSVDTKQIHQKTNLLSTETHEAELAATRQLKDLRSRHLPDLIPGLRVRISGSSQTGVLVKKQKDGKWVVSAGVVKMTVAEDQLSLAEANETKVGYFTPSADQKRFFSTDQHTASGPSRTAMFTLDLRGMRLQAAIEELTRQIDDAMVQGLFFFSIIHGKGTGALQKGVHDFLGTLGCVKSFSFARPEDGGTGKTLVYLKED
ncbi:endonuclease MutS2 [Spirochaeta lutea]|uniref:Endonuclease MutS2 n=1 Tax=Spirochaeta lutea TaxID=1480694 RepID=A0A098R4R2_9SPIO|nr:endonuclease MutS2 [Spirochaeta lutea]KGE73742.1 hypothetical protein DC28_00455 [Spirochaeta lutea]